LAGETVFVFPHRISWFFSKCIVLAVGFALSAFGSEKVPRQDWPGLLGFPHDRPFAPKDLLKWGFSGDGMLGFFFGGV